MTRLTAEKIVVPVDFSDESIDAVDAALQIAGGTKGVHVVHVLPDVNPTDPGVIWQTIDNESRTRHATQALLERLTESKYDGLDIHIEIGDAGYRIASYSEEIAADLIVMPSHGRRGLSRALIGSVAERVIRHAHCHVLVLRN